MNGVSQPQVRPVLVCERARERFCASQPMQTPCAEDSQLPCSRWCLTSDAVRRCARCKANMYMCIYACMYVCMYVYIYIYILALHSAHRLTASDVRHHRLQCKWLSSAHGVCIGWLAQKRSRARSQTSAGRTCAWGTPFIGAPCTPGWADYRQPDQKKIRSLSNVEWTIGSSRRRQATTQQGMAAAE